MDLQLLRILYSVMDTLDHNGSCGESGILQSPWIRQKVMDPSDLRGSYREPLINQIF
jgi:hypothetical protein